jgi:hypothetical protein
MYRSANRLGFAVAVSVTLMFGAQCNGKDADRRASDTTSKTATLRSAMVAVTRPEPAREWTLMVFMNGDNNLEPFAIKDFREMAKVGSTNEVNIVVQLDRIAGYTADADDWTDARRFRVTRGMEPTSDAADPSFAQEVDMGAPDALADFVRWARMHYPAKRYGLVIWDHGAGWRLFMRDPSLNRAERAKRAATFDSLVLIAPSRDRARIATARIAGVDRPGPPFDHPVKSVSHDETSGSQLFNRAIQNVLERELAGARLDVLGFDACLMAMVETAYAMRNVAEVMVASEELEPGDGWQYERVLQPLVERPSMTGKELGTQIVNAFKEEYQNKPMNTTLSAIDLRRVSALATAASALGDALTHSLNNAVDRTRVGNARRACAEYAFGTFHNIDVVCLTRRLATGGTRELRTAATNMQRALASSIVANFADTRMGSSDFVSAGAAIYFPATGEAFNADPLRDAYRNGLAPAQWPVQFVDDHRWDEFLASYVTRFP